MGSKGYNGLVSRYLDPENRAWETVVYQSSKPILDSEQNLIQDLSLESGTYDHNRLVAPSGWVRGDFLNGKVDFVYSASTPNHFKFINKPIALVNGFKVPVEYTNTTDAGQNDIVLPPPPSATSPVRVDLVYLEVWRSLLSASPSMTNKSSGGRIWRNGNTGVASGDDAALNFADDILDPTAGSETSKRVQVQYLIRVFPGVNIDTYPDGLNDPTVYAYGAHGSATTYQFANMGAATGDVGLWRAGTGVPSNDLNTVDGYSYAIPICAVFRRNTTAFSQSTNHNGGVVSPGPSDRPDGLFSDEIYEGDVLDLRKGVTLTGWDFDEVLEKSFSSLLDDELAQIDQNTSENPGYTNGSRGVLVLHANKIGDATGSGDIGDFDGIRRRFSDRSIVERPIVIRQPAAVNWVDGESIELDLASFDPYPLIGVNVIGHAPAGTKIADVVSAYFDGGTATGKTPAFFKEIRDLGTTNVTLVLSAPPAGITSQKIWIEVEINYPQGVGLGFTPYADFGDHYRGDGGTTYTLEDNDAGLRPTDFYKFINLGLTYANREVQVAYETTEQTVTVRSKDATSVILPERIYSVVSVTEGATPKTFASITPNDPERKITITGTPLSGPAVSVVVVYRAIRVMSHIAGYFNTIYYRSRALQTIKDTQLPTSLAYRIVYVSPYIYALTAGTGSFGVAYPYETPTHHIPVNEGTFVFTGEQDLDSPLDTFTDDFDASSGFLRVEQAIPLVTLSQATLERTAGVDIDSELRAFYPNAATAEYKPAAFGKNLSFPQRHKVFFPVIAELTANAPFATKGSLVLMVFTRWANFDNENNVRFVSVSNTSCAALYKLKGNLLLNRREY
jgi:hypothetical protein